MKPTLMDNESCFFFINSDKRFIIFYYRQRIQLRLCVHSTYIHLSINNWNSGNMNNQINHQDYNCNYFCKRTQTRFFKSIYKSQCLCILHLKVPIVICSFYITFVGVFLI